MIPTLQSLIQRILPNYCLLCQSPTQSTFALCQLCIQDLPWQTESACHYCALPLPYPAICGQCLKEPPPFERVVSAFHYKPPLNSFLSQLKFGNKLTYAHILGRLLGYYLRQQGPPFPQVVLPVPLHRERLQQRGFNQAAEIAKHIAKVLRIPCCQQYLKRHKATQPQTELKASERQHNIKDAFSITHPIPYQHIAIVDDVMTTGATLRQICHIVKQSGVMQIDVWCVARAKIQFQEK